jgi:TetR/AcrR family transcriptional regulator
MHIKRISSAAKRQPVTGRRKTRPIGRPAGTQQAVGRDALIDKTCELLQKLPPDRITRAEVARSTNVDPSLIRYYFQDRASLMVAAAERLSQEFAKNFAKRVKQSDRSPESRLRARVAAQFDLNISHPFYHRLLLEEILNSEAPQARKLMDDLTRSAAMAYESILTELAGSGRLRQTHPLYLFMAVAGMCEFFVGGLPVLKIAKGRKLDEKAAGREYRDFVCDLLLHGLTGRTQD